MKAITSATPPAAVTASGKISINGTEITLTGGGDAATSGVATAADINKVSGTTGVTASVDAATGKMTLTSKSDFTIEDGAPAGALAKTGLTAAPVKAVAVTDATLMGSNGGVSVNGTEVKWGAADSIKTVIDKLATKAGTGATASFKDGRVTLTSGDGKDIKLANTEKGSLSQLGLSAGTSQAKLTADTSIELNGVEVKFKKGDTSDAIVASINSASTGVTASKNADGTLKLFADKNITVKDGSAGTGLAALGLKDGTKSATTMETTVADLSVLSAASAQQAIQALDGAMQQIDSQRSQLGAVQNRFASTVSNLQSIAQNSAAAKGRVEDADFAAETAELTKQQTLQQASTAILSQANQLPSSVLKLLQ
jgi:flagellin